MDATFAVIEAKRRAAVMDRAYAIYQKIGTEDYILRPKSETAPQPTAWRRVAIIQPDGSRS